MLDLDCLTESFEWIDLGFVEREATPKPAMKLGIRLHMAGLSLSDTVSVLEAFGVDRHRTTVQKWVQKADQQPADGRSPNHVALDETVIWINDEQFWLFAVTRSPRLLVGERELCSRQRRRSQNESSLHARLFPTRTTVTTRMFLDDLRAKYQIDDATFLVDRGPWLHAALHRLDLRFRHVTYGNRNAIERVFREVKRRTGQFSNCFSHADPKTAETWLQTFAVHHNALI